MLWSFGFIFGWGGTPQFPNGLHRANFLDAPLGLRAALSHPPLPSFFFQVRGEQCAQGKRAKANPVGGGCLCCAALQH